MKRIYLMMLLALGVAANAQAQRNPDVTILHGLGKTQAGVTLVKNGDRIIWDGGDGPTTPVKYYAAWWIVNHGATAADTLQTGDSLTIFSPWGTRYIGTGISMGQHDTTGAITPNPNNPIQFKPNDTVTSRAESVDWCDSVWVRQGPSSITPMNETNKANNITCNTVTLDLWAVNVKNVQFIEGNGLAVFPNPATGKLNFAYDFGTNSNGNVVIVDLLGKAVYQKELKGMSGMQEVPVEVSHLIPGMYILKVSANGQVATERFTIK